MPVERVVTVHSMNLVLCFVTTYSPGDGIVVLELQEKPVFQSRQLDELKYSWWNIHFKCLMWNKNREINLFSHIQLPNKLHDWESAHFKVTNMIKCIYIYYIYGFSDIDECKGNHSCHVNATCTNTNGSFVCECQPGFNGNGQNCIGEFNLFAIIFRILLLESLRWQLSAILLICHM